MPGAALLAAKAAQGAGAGYVKILFDGPMMAPADLVVFDYLPYTPVTPDNLAGHLVFGLSQSAVDTTIAAGRVLMENKKLNLDIDEEEVSRKSLELAKKLWNRF